MFIHLLSMKRSTQRDLILYSLQGWSSFFFWWIHCTIPLKAPSSSCCNALIQKRGDFFLRLLRLNIPSSIFLKKLAVIKMWMLCLIWEADVTKKDLIFWVTGNMTVRFDFSPTLCHYMEFGRFLPREQGKARESTFVTSFTWKTWLLYFFCYTEMLFNANQYSPKSFKFSIVTRT